MSFLDFSHTSCKVRSHGRSSSLFKTASERESPEYVSSQFLDLPESTVALRLQVFLNNNIIIIIITCTKINIELLSEDVENEEN